MEGRTGAEKKGRMGRGRGNRRGEEKWRKIGMDRGENERGKELFSLRVQARIPFVRAPLSFQSPSKVPTS